MYNFSKTVTTACNKYSVQCNTLLNNRSYVEEFLDFPLSEIFWDLSLNEKRYEFHYSAQLVLVHKYNIPTFEILYKIVSVLGFKNNLKWDKISMPVDKFQELDNYIKYHIHKNKITQEEYIHIAQQIWYFDLTKLYKWLCIIWFADDLHKILFSYEEALGILLYVTAVYHNHMLLMADWERIYRYYFDRFGSQENDKSITDVTKFLIGFGYEIEYKNKQSSK